MNIVISENLQETIVTREDGYYFKLSNVNPMTQKNFNSEQEIKDFIVEFKSNPFAWLPPLVESDSTDDQIVEPDSTDDQISE